MSENANYFYMRLKDSFFESDELIIMESMDNGYIYSNILLKLYLRSLKREGKLMLNDIIPYNADILAKVTRHEKGIVEEALKIFEDLGLVEILDSGAIYMTNIQEYIGKSSTEADRKREYRKRIEKDKCPDTEKDKCLDASPPYKENKVREEKKSDNTFFNSLTLNEGDTLSPSADAGEASPFTLTDCQNCADEGKVNLSESGIQAFYNRMQKDGWKIKGKPVTNLLLAMRGFAKNHKRYQNPKSEEPEPEELAPRGSAGVQEADQDRKSSSDMIEAAIYRTAINYISAELFSKNKGGEHCLIRDYCPKEAFTEKQLEYMANEWNIWPRTQEYVLKDEFLE